MNSETASLKQPLAERRNAALRVLRAGGRLALVPLRSAAAELAGVVRSVATQRPVIAITFDDGPHPETTPEVLRILDKHGAKATFFMIGELAAQHGDLVRAAAAAGHAIANHSWSHASFPLITARERHDELRRCEQALAPHGAKLFRPPYCHQTLWSGWNARRAGYDVIAYSVHAEDWLPRPSEWMAEKIAREARPGAILILHDNIHRSILADAAMDRRPMLRALDAALGRLCERFSFVTVPELLRQGTACRVVWQSRGSGAMLAPLQEHVRERRRGSAQQAG